MIRRIPKRYWIGAAAVIVVVGVGLHYLSPSTHSAAPGPQTRMSDAGGEDNRTRVSVIHAKKDPLFVISIQQIASVRAYFQVELKARVAGVIQNVYVDVGDIVKKGTPLLEIDVPDLAKDVLQKRAMVEQRRQELKLAEAKVKSAAAMVDVAKSSVAQQRAGVIQAEASRDYRKKRLDRFRDLLKRQAINDDLVDEQVKEFQAGEGAYEMAQAATLKAEADVKEKDANLETSRVEVDLKKSLVEVGQRDLEHAQALADYAKISAPFDGVIIKRNVSPGHFVQNASSGVSESLLTLARIDIVTVGAKIPDNAAPFISKNTGVSLQIDQLPGLKIHAKVTRFSPSIDSLDRTMWVEVDLQNSPHYSKDDLRSGTAESLLATGYVLNGRTLLPGMNGYMRVRLGEMADAYLIPSSAVFNRGGKPYLMFNQDGKAQLVPVDVQVNDGKLAKVSILRTKTSGVESRVELNGSEEIVASRQAELDDGQPIQAVFKDW